MAIKSEVNLAVIGVRVVTDPIIMTSAKPLANEPIRFSVFKFNFR